MATLEHKSTGSLAAHSPAIQRPRLRWTRILSISIFWLALSFHWAALGIIIAVLLALMLITIVSVREKKYPAAQRKAQDAAPYAQNPWFKRIRPSQLRNVFGTLMVAGAAWGIIQLWNGQLPELYA